MLAERLCERVPQFTVLLFPVADAVGGCFEPARRSTPEAAAGYVMSTRSASSRAAEIFGRSERVLSRVLEGFYQSH